MLSEYLEQLDLIGKRLLELEVKHQAEWEYLVSEEYQTEVQQAMHDNAHDGRKPWEDE